MATREEKIEAVNLAIGYAELVLMTEIGKGHAQIYSIHEQLCELLDDLKEPCVWEWVEKKGVWQGTCGMGSYEDYPFEFGENFCPWCGRRLEEKED